MRVPLIFIRDRRFFSSPSTKFIKRRKRSPYAGGKQHYVFGDPPLGIMYLSSALKQAGHEVSLWDQCHPDYTDERLIEELKRERPAMVGISFLSNLCYPGARRLSRKIKTALPATKIVYGGVFPTINAREIIANEESVDIVARGEGETIIRDLAAGLEQLGDIPGITFRSSTGEVIENVACRQIADLDTIPFPDRQGLDINYVAILPLEAPAVIFDRPYTTIVSSRGCPFGCTYCNCPTFSDRKVRVRSAANVLAELAEIERLGFSSFTFVDDNFLLDPERAQEICAGMKAAGHTFRWTCEGRADPRVKGVFRHLAAAGCDLVMFGIESGSQQVLDSLQKKTTLPVIADAVAEAKRAGIGIRHGFFIVGSPGETEADLRATFDFAERIELNSFNFNRLLAFRGTPLWNDAVAQGLIDDAKDWDKLFPLHLIHPDTIDTATLYALRSRLVKRLIWRKVLRNPREAGKLFARVLDCMSARDLYRLLTSSNRDHTSMLSEQACASGDHVLGQP